MLGTTASLSLRYLLIAAGCTTLGALAASASRDTQVSIVRVPELKVVETVVERTAEAPPAQSREVHLLVKAGGASYMKLAAIGEGAEPMPKHGALSLHDDDGIQSVVATVAAADLPTAYRAWLGREVTVDGTCKAKVTGFAVIARLTGSPDYAGENVDRWTAKTVFAEGSRLIAAQLDGCTGTLVRDAALSPTVYPVLLEDDATVALAEKAKAALLATPAASDIQRAWGVERTGPWTQGANVTYQVVRHPLSEITWISVNVSADFGCGDPDANLWGLYRVAPDGSLVESRVRALENGTTVEELVDLDDDGEFELIGRTWLDLERTVTTASGEPLQELALPFFGCPC
ncbi:MAG: hypothetical protein HOV81_38350 [Kofleriaceae bacterium]|nr:hypothetical protein [Kofleriaceae bacterium]